MAQLDDQPLPHTEQIRLCHQIYARHRPRADDHRRCAFCGGPWRRTVSERTGRPVDGCAARQLVGRLLDDNQPDHATRFDDAHQSMPHTPGAVSGENRR